MRSLWWFQKSHQKTNINIFKDLRVNAFYYTSNIIFNEMMYTPENQHETQNRRFGVIFRFQPFVLSVSLSWGIATKPTTWTMISWLVQVPGFLIFMAYWIFLKHLDRISFPYLNSKYDPQTFYDPDSTFGYKMGPPAVTQDQKKNPKLIWAVFQNKTQCLSHDFSVIIQVHWQKNQRPTLT